MLLFGLKYRKLILPSAGVMALFMIAAVYFHLSISDPIIPTAPSLLMLASCLSIIYLDRRIHISRPGTTTRFNITDIYLDYEDESKDNTTNSLLSLNKAIETGERQNYTLQITATTPKISNDIVAEFSLTLSIKDCFGSKIKKNDILYLSGGVSNSIILPQLISNVLNIKVKTLDSSELGALGIGYLISSYLNKLPLNKIINKYTKTNNIYLPNKKNLNYFKIKYTKYKKLRESLNEIW